MRKLKVSCLLLASLFVMFFSSCTYDANKIKLKTENEILNFMNKNFPGNFTFSEGDYVEKYEFLYEQKIIIVHMDCQLSDDKIIQVWAYDYASFSPIFGWIYDNDFIRTNYYYVYYKEELETDLMLDFNEKFSPISNKYEMKLFVDDFTGNSLPCELNNLKYNAFYNEAKKNGTYDFKLVIFDEEPSDIRYIKNVINSVFYEAYQFDPERKYSDISVELFFAKDFKSRKEEVTLELINNDDWREAHFIERLES